MADRSGKTQPQPAVHHTAKLPVAQDQVAIDEALAPLSGIKSTKTISAVETKFTQADTQIRDPVPRPVVQTVKTVKDPVARPLTQTVKTIQNPVARPVVQTVKTAEDPSIRPLAQTVKTIKDPVSGTRDVKTVKTRFSQQDSQVRNPVVQPVTKSVQIISDPATDSIKTLKTVTKTQRDPIARPVIQTIKTTDDLPASIKTSEPSPLRSKMTLKTSQKTTTSSTTGVPESIVSAARRNTMRTVLPPEAISPGTQSMYLVSEERRNTQLINNPGSPIQAGLEMINNKGEIILDDDTLKLLQNAGSIIKENGEISMNEEAIRIIQNVRGSVSPVTTRDSSNNVANVISEGQAPGPSAQIIPSADIFSSDKVVVQPIVRTTNLGQTRRLSNSNQRQQATNRAALLRSQINTLQNTVSRSNLGDLSLGNTGGISGVAANGQVLRSTSASGIQRGDVSATRPGIPLSVDLKSSNDQNVLLSGSFGQRRPVSDSRRGSVAEGIRIQTTGSLDLGTGIRNQGSITTVTGSSRRSGSVITGSRSGVTANTLSPAENKQGVRSSDVSSQRLTTLQRSSITAEQTSRIRRPKPVQDYGLSSPSSRGSVRNNLQPGTRIGSISDASLRSQDALRGQIPTINDETILFNGKEISLSGLKPGQLFDENLKPILPGISDSAQVEGFLSTLNQNIKPESIRDIQRISSTPRVRTGAISIRGRQQAANIMKEEIKLRTQGGASGVSVDQRNLQSNTVNPLISSGISQSMPAINKHQETVLFNGKEISISGLRAGQQFDENLQPILTSNIDTSKPIEINRLNVRPASAPGVLQSAGLPAVSPDLPLQQGNARRRQQAINTPENKLKFRIPNRAASMPSSQINTKPSISIDAPRSSDIGKTGEIENINTVLFNGKEISVSGMRSGQIFDENLQPVMPEITRVVSPVNVRTSAVRQIVKPAAKASVSNSVSQQRRRRPIVASTPVLRNPQPSVLDSNQLNIPPAGIIPTPEISLNQEINTGAFNAEIRQNEKILVTSSGQRSGVSGDRSIIDSYVDSLRSYGGRVPQISSAISSDKISDTDKLSNLGASDAIIFNGQEISISGLKAGQLFDENLRPISSDVIDAPETGNTATLGMPQRPSLGAEMLKYSKERSRSTTSSTLGTSHGSIGIGSPQRSQTPSAGVLRRTESASPQRSSSAGLRRSGVSQSVQPGSTGSRISSTASQSNLRQQSGIISSGFMSSVISQSSGISAAAPGALRTNSLLTQQSPGRNRGQNVRPQSLPGSTLRSQGVALPELSSFGSRTGQIIPGIVLPGKEVQPFPELRASIPVQPQSVAGGTLRANNVRKPQLPALRAPVKDPVNLSAQQTPTIRNSAVAGNVVTEQNVRPQSLLGSTLRSQGAVLPGSTELSTFGTRRGQIIPGNVLLGGEIQPFPELRAEIPVQPQSLREGSLRANYVRRTQQAALRAPAKDPVILSAQRTPAISNAPKAENANIVLFNGKEINIGEIREGQMFDENLQPIPSLNFDNAKADVSPLVIPQTLKPDSGSGSSQRAAVQRTSSKHGSDILKSPELRAPTPIKPQNTRRGSLRTNTIRRPQQPVLRTPAKDPILLSVQRTLAVSNVAVTGNVATVLFNGKEINVGEIREGQLFDENLQPIPSLNSKDTKVDDNPFTIPQTLKPASGSGSSQRATARRTSSTYSSDILKSLEIRAPTPTQPQSIREGSLRTNTVRIPQQSVLRTPAKDPVLLSVQRTPAVSNAVVTGNVATVLFNGKEINVGEIKEGQLFDENLQPIHSLNSDHTKVDGSPLTIPQTVKPASESGSSQRAAARRTSSAYDFDILTSRGVIQRQRLASTAIGGESRMRVPVSSTTIAAQPGVQNVISGANLMSPRVTSNRQGEKISNENTILFNGKEINVAGLKAGQIFDENLQPIVTSNVGNVLSDIRSQRISLDRSQARTSAASGLRPESPRQTSSVPTSNRSGSLGLRSPAVPRQNSQALGSTLTSSPPSGNRVGSGSQRNRITGVFQRISSDQGTLLTSTAGSGAPVESSLLSSADINTVSNSGSVLRKPQDIYTNIPIHSSRIGGSSLQRKNSLDRISQEVSQVNIENPVIEQKEAGIVLTKIVDPVPSKETQLPIEEILEQKSLPKPHLLKSEQVQENIPFTASEITQKVPSKTTVTKLSQVSQKDIDIPIFQQRVMAGDYKGYLPITSFLPPFNYGLPQASTYQVKTPIVQEQQRLEQVFV